MTIVFAKDSPKHTKPELFYPARAKNHHHWRLVHPRIIEILKEDPIKFGEDSYHFLRTTLKKKADKELVARSTLSQLSTCHKNNDHSRVRSKVIKVPYFLRRIDLITHIPKMRASIFDGGYPGELLMKNQEEAVKSTASGEGDVPEFKCSFEMMVLMNLCKRSIPDLVNLEATELECSLWPRYQTYL